MPPAAQSAVWAELPARLAAFGFKTFRLAAGPDVAGDFIARSFRETTGRWRLVSASAEASVAVVADARPQLDDHPDAVTATFDNGTRLTLIKHDKVRVFGFSSREDVPRMDTVALVLPKGRAQRDLKEPGAASAGFAPVPLDDPFAEALEAVDGGRFMLRNALGIIEAGYITRHDADPDANAPPDVKISKAFVALAIFHCDDPDWLAAALAP